MQFQLADVHNEYKKFPNLRKSDVLELMDWCERQPHLPNLNEFEIIIFLHSCYYKMESTKTCIDTSFTFRTHQPQFFAKRNVFGEDIKKQMDLFVFTPLPGLSPDGYKLLYCKAINSDVSTFVLADALKLFMMVADLWIMEEGSINGHIILFDMDGVVFGHLIRLGLFAIKNFITYLQDGMPVRLKGLHFINTVSFMDKILALMRPFFKKEMLDIIKLHLSVETFLEYVNKEQLPNEYGGRAGTLKALQEKSFNHIQENGEFFVNEEITRRVNDSLRPMKIKKS